MLELQKIVLKKEDKTILDHVNLTIRTGEIHSIPGMNGTGKTALAYAIMGLPGYKPSGSKIIRGAKDSTNLSISDRARLGITLAWQEPARFEGLTVREYLRLGQRRNGSPSVEECLRLVGLGPCTFAYFAPVLGVVFGISMSCWVKVMLLIAAFGIGHCAVIVGAGSLTHLVQKNLNLSSQSKATACIRRIAGVFVLLGGVYFIDAAF